jgi:hypothetical protein
MMVLATGASGELAAARPFPEPPRLQVHWQCTWLLRPGRLQRLFDPRARSAMSVQFTNPGGGLFGCNTVPSGG